MVKESPVRLTRERDPNEMVPAPLTSAIANVTPGWDLLYVLDVERNQLVPDVTRVDCDAGMVWASIIPGGRSHPFPGKFRLVCLPETLRAMEHRWKSLP